MGRPVIAAAVVLVGLLLASSATGGEPGWASQVVKPLSERAQLQQTPIIDRPYRPLHFYGNTVRRMHYHGRAVPSVREMGAGLRAFTQR